MSAWSVVVIPGSLFRHRRLSNDRTGYRRHGLPPILFRIRCTFATDIMLCTNIAPPAQKVLLTLQCCAKAPARRAFNEASCMHSPASRTSTLALLRSHFVAFRAECAWLYRLLHLSTPGYRTKYGLHPTRGRCHLSLCPGGAQRARVLRRCPRHVTAIPLRARVVPLRGTARAGHRVPYFPGVTGCQEPTLETATRSLPPASPAVPRRSRAQAVCVKAHCRVALDAAIWGVGVEPIAEH